MASREDYVMVADCINKVLNTYKEIDDSVEMESNSINIFTRMLVECLCSKYYQDNKNFDEDKFKDAIYKNVWEELISNFEGTIWIQ